MLHDDIVNPAASQPSEETSGAFPLVEKGFLCFSGADDCWEAHPSALTDTICVFQRSLPCCCSQLMKQHVCALKIVTGVPWERFQILIFCKVLACSFLPLLRHYALLVYFLTVYYLCPHSVRSCLLSLKIRTNSESVGAGWSSKSTFGNQVEGTE